MIEVVSPKRLIEEFSLTRLPFDPEPSYNVAPTQKVVAVRQSHGEREAVQMKWGLLPFWAKDESQAARMINARCESIGEKPAFRSAFRSRRCLIPASGFYEWQKLGGEKLPYHFSLKDKDLFAFAGLWEQWRNANREVVETCTIITTEPNELLANFHNRMPVILHSDSYREWLDDETRDVSLLKELLRPYPAEDMIHWPVGKAVGSVRNQGPELMKSIAI